IGLGRIAAHFLEGTNNSAQSKITALVSGHRDKAERIAAQYGVPTGSIYSYEDFGRIASNRAVEAVYVALPNSMHAEYTIRAAKAGKHVLCEKPMEISSARCVQMIDACRTARVKLMIAYRLYYEPTHIKALEIIRSGKLGLVQSLDATTAPTCAPARGASPRPSAAAAPCSTTASTRSASSAGSPASSPSPSRP